MEILLNNQEDFVSFKISNGNKNTTENNTKLRKIFQKEMEFCTNIKEPQKST